MPIALALTLALAARAAAPPPPPFSSSSVSYERQVAELCFPSGLRVTVLPDRRQPVVSVTAVIDRGSDRDPTGREGAAHLLEHAWFRARPQGGPPVGQVLDDLGAVSNGYTLADATVYTTVADARALPALLALEAGRLADPLAGVNDATLEQERAIVRSEHRLRGFTFADLPRLMPADLHGSGAPLRPSSDAAIRAIRRVDLEQVARAYAPASTTLLVAGDVSQRDVLTAIEQGFPEHLLYVAADGSQPARGDCAPRRDAGAHQPPPPPPPGPPMTVTLDAEVPVLLMGWSLPPAWGAEEPQMRLATLWVRRAMAAALDRGRLAQVRTGCTLVPGARHSTLMCSATLPDGVSGDKVRERLRQAVDGASAPGDRARVGEAVQWLRTDVALGLEDLSPVSSGAALADALSNQFTGTPAWYLDALEAYDRLDERALSGFMRAWITADRARESLVLPPGADRAAIMAGRKDDEDTARVVAATDALEQADADEPVGVHHRWTARGGAVAQPKVSPARLATPAAWTLPSGLRVVVVPHGEVPVAQVALRVGGGPLAEALPGLDAWAWDLLAVSAAGLPRGSTRLAAEGLGARIWASSMTDGRVLGLTGSVATLDGQLWLLRNWADTAARHPSDAFVNEQRRAARRAHAAAAQEPGVRQWEARQRHVLGEAHPLAASQSTRRFQGSSHAERAVDRHLAATWQPANATLVVVGDVDPQAVRAQIDRWFGSWSGPRKGAGPLLPTREAAPAPTERAAFVEAVPERSSARLALSCRVDAAASSAVRAVGEALVFGAVWSALRESDIGAYDPYAVVAPLGAEAVLHLGATVPPEHVAAAATAIDALVDRLGAEGPAPDTLARVSGRLRARYPSELVEIDSVLWTALAHGADLGAAVAGHPEALAAVTPADVRAWAAPCAPGAALSVLGPAAAPLQGTPWQAALR